MAKLSNAVRIGILGASGYTGAELLRLLARHPQAEIRLLTAHAKAGKTVAEVFPHLGQLDLPKLVKVEDADWSGLDVVFCALPHGTTQDIIAKLPRHLKVVDLSADFRLHDLATYAKWYGHEHKAPALQKEAVYGITELARAAVQKARLVANPGCYPTATLLALAPLAGHLADVVVDAKSGVSGAGRKATDTTHFVSADENVTPYGVGRHRHMPEIDQELHAAGAPRHLKVTFTPHLMPLDQGELVSCYATLADPLNHPVDEIFARAYAHEPFVEVVDRLPGVRDVRDTNMCRIAARMDERTGKVFVFAAIDNLWKGASSQAVQNLNLMFGLDETAGLQ
jgi:N-acetyl-gamma-glutamyl-phosphate reductase